MDTSTMMNALITQRRRYCAIIQMNEFYNINALMVQRCKRCTFDSPGLTSESVGYPGLFAVSSNNAVGVVPFILCRFIAAFHAENVQHLRRWFPHYMHNPGLASESEGYPGLFAVSGNNAVGVVPFILCRFIAAFHAEKARHLRRWPPHYMHNPG